MPSELLRHFTLDPEVTFLNHGSFGACPRVVQAAQLELRTQMERQPVRFFTKTLRPKLDAARARVAAFVGSAPENLVFVRNATVGVNTGLYAFDLGARDEVLVTDQGYNACNNAAERWAARVGASVRVAKLPFPCEGPEQIVERLLDAVTSRTRLAIVDAVTSPTGLVMPLPRIVAELKARGVETLVDGAHAIGMLPLELDALGAAFFTANAHKWLCAPKGAAILHVRPDLQTRCFPLSTSHGMNVVNPERPRLWIEHDWTGTDDFTPALVLPECIDFLQGVLPGGVEAVRAHNHALVVAGRKLICERLGVAPAAPEAMLGSLATVLVPGRAPEGSTALDFADPLAHALAARHIEVPVFPWKGQRCLRISAQVYNALEDYEVLAEALGAELDRPASD